MPITPPVEQWLKDAGYDWHCFISYPRIKTKDGNDDLTHPISQCARGVKEAIIQGLSFSIPKPRVFLDLDDIPPGNKWEPTVKGALCKSLVMVAICAGIYYHPEHEWCGLEWAAMDHLSEMRFPGDKLLTIVPVMVKIEKPLPPTVERPQWVNISGLMTGRRRFRPTDRFNNIIYTQVVSHIEAVAQALRQKEVKTDCAHFSFPDKSAFSDWETVSQLPPFYEKPMEG